MIGAYDPMASLHQIDVTPRMQILMQQEVQDLPKQVSRESNSPKPMEIAYQT